MGDDGSPPEQACRSAALSKSGWRIARVRSISIGMTLPAAAPRPEQVDSKEALDKPKSFARAKRDRRVNQSL